MKLLIINTTSGVGSTGYIASEIAKEYHNNGWEVKIGYGLYDVPKELEEYSVRIGTNKNIAENYRDCIVYGNEGFNAKKATEEFLEWAEEYNPDMVWLHNLHGYYINVEMLFDWIKKHEKLVVYWTLHDCWSFTGQCCHFIVNNCNKWETGCNNCEYYYEYPMSSIDNSEENYQKKKKAFLGVKNLTIITPSKWLESLVRRSFLKEYRIEVRNNTVDTTIFKHTESDFRNRYGLEEKKIILGVAYSWTKKKGLDVFCSLSEKLPDEYKIVLVGISPKQKEKLPPQILTIPIISSKEELAKIYSSADVYLNPSREETFGMTTLEALMCGTKTVVFKGTACEEVADKYGGIVVEDNVDIIISTILELTQ